MNTHRAVNGLAHAIGLTMIMIGVEANSTDADVMAPMDPGRGSATVGAQPPDCGRARFRDGAKRAHPVRDDTLDRPPQGCFADILQALAEEMGAGAAPARLADRASSGTAVVSVSASTTLATDVEIPDTGLREALAQALGKGPGEAIAADEMATLTSLSAVDRGIIDLTGLRHATSLRVVDLDRNAITDISELGRLTALTSVSLAGNAVADASPLSSLSRLESLSLARNGLRDVEALAGLTSLETLDLAGNELANVWRLNLLTQLRDLRLNDNDISDLPALQDLQELTTLTLDGNWIEDVGPLGGLGNLRALSLSDNLIANIWPLSGLTDLERLWLRGNRIADVSALADLTGLAQLWLGSNELTDVSPLGGLAGLQVLDLDGNSIGDITPLAGLTDIVGLGLADNRIADATALAGLSELTALDLSGNDLDDLPPLGGSGNLTTLSLHSNRISGLSGLAGADGLTWLDLAANDVEDIGPLSGLSGLTTLDLSNNDIEDIGPVAGLDKVQWLYVHGNGGLSDLSPLSGLTSLAALSAAGNDVTDLAPLAGLTSLRRLWLHDNGFADVSSLAGLADLRVLTLGENVVVDVSPLKRLAELRHLYLDDNDIRDVEPLSGLTKLSTLVLDGNEVVDIAPLSGLRDMRVLSLGSNDIAEIGEVGGLKNLWLLVLANNDIADIAELADNSDMGRGDIVDLRQNPLSAQAFEDVDVLRGRGVLVAVDGPDLVAESASVSEAELAAGASFTLSATVRNAGAGAAATTLRYYRSGDAGISAADTEVGTDAVAGLAAGAESAESISLTAPSAVGTYYYGACVDTVPGEADTINNCSDGVAVEVSHSGGGTGDDHGDTFASATSIGVPSTTDGELEEGGDRDYFRFEVASAGTLTVGTSGSTDTYGTLFDSNETSLERDDDDGPGRNFEIDRDVAAGRYFLEVRGYSTSITGTYKLEVAFVSAGGSATPDLVAESVAVSDANPEPGASFTLDATVRNAGDGDAAATTLRYYRSDDAAITTGDSEVATDAVAALAAGASSTESITLTAPSSGGTYYYGACVDTVSGESDTTNNCSDGVAVEVSGGTGSAVGVCGRTPEIRDALVAATGRGDCSEVTDDDLAGVRSLLTGRLSELREDDLQGLVNLTWLGLCRDRHDAYLPRGSLSTVPDRLFAHTPNLEHLSINGCSISELPADVFSELTLSSLGIREPHTRLPVFPTFSASHDYDATMELSGTHLVSLPAGAFAETGLVTLYLEDNDYLTDVFSGTFRGLPQLEHLSLSWGSIETLPADAFADLPALRSLQVAVNKLQTLPQGLILPRRLEHLNLNGNPLTGLPANLFAGLDRLTDLRIEWGGNLTLAADSFEGLDALETLQLTGSGIPELPAGVFGGLHNLNSLLLAANGIEALPEGFFDGLTSLEAIELHDNPGSPFAVRFDLERSDAAAAAPGPARVRVKSDTGFPMSGSLRLSIVNGSSESESVEFERGTLAADEFAIAQDSASKATHAGLGPLPETASSLQGLEFTLDDPLVLFAESENRMPIPLLRIAHRKLQVGGEDWTYDMVACFSDVDGDALTWDGHVADSDVAIVSPSAAGLVISPVSEGTTTVTVTASDPGGLDVSQDFDLVVEPRPDRTAFHIDLDYAGVVADRERRIVEEARDRWTSIITGDIPEVPVTASSDCTNSDRIFTGRIDDLRVAVSVSAGLSNAAAWASVDGIREESSLPFRSAIWLGSAVRYDDDALRHIVLHEFGHALGFIAAVWEELGYLHNPSRTLGPGADTHFNGPLAVQAFDDAGGTGFTARSKVPLSNHGASNSDNHWEFAELMDVAGGGPLSAITVQLFADLGYEVDASQADEYTLPQAFTMSASRLARRPAGAWPHAGAFRQGPHFPERPTGLANDVRATPIEVVNRRGERVRLIAPQIEPIR